MDIWIEEVDVFSPDAFNIMEKDGALKNYANDNSIVEKRFLACGEGHLLGLATCESLKRHRGDEVAKCFPQTYAFQIIVREKYRQLGIGKSLVQFVIKRYPHIKLAGFLHVSKGFQALGRRFKIDHLDDLANSYLEFTSSSKGY